MMFARILTALLLLNGTSAFGTFSRVQNNVRSSAEMTMRIGSSDLFRRQRFNKILQTVQPNPTKESVENVLLSEETSKVIAKV